jgi:putative flippase GtrA
MGQKLFRYSMTSVVAVIVTQVCFLVFVGLIRMDAVLASTLSTAIAAVPSYEMNRKWAWGKSGKSHLWREVVPFWALAFIGWAFSTTCVYFMQRYANHHHFSHLSKTVWVDAVFIGAFGVLWVGKFIIFNKVMFVHHHHLHDDQPASAA